MTRKFSALVIILLLIIVIGPLPSSIVATLIVIFQLITIPLCMHRPTPFAQALPCLMSHWCLASAMAIRSRWHLASISPAPITHQSRTNYTSISPAPITQRCIRLRWSHFSLACISLVVVYLRVIVSRLTMLVYIHTHIVLLNITLCHTTSQHNLVLMLSLIRSTFHHAMHHPKVFTHRHAPTD